MEDAEGSGAEDRLQLLADRRTTERYRRTLEAEQDDGLVMRPLTSEAAIAVARKLLAEGAPGIEEREDGRIWALGVDRRQGDRRS
jgi:hypothetical protein